MLFSRKFFLIFLSLVAFLLSSFSLSDEEERKEIKIESITAESISNDEKGNLLLEGKVFITTNLLTFSTDKALFNQSEGVIELFGNVEVKSEKVKLNSSEVLANLNRQTLSVKQADINSNDSVFSNAQEFLLKTSGDVELVNASVTSCSKEDPIWVISTKRITYLADKNNAVIRGIRLTIKNVPVFFWPYVRTAVGNEKISGFLTPGIRQTNDGIDISLPYYLNLAPNYDLVLTPRHITNRGSGIASSFRYLSRKLEGEINLSGISSDEVYQEETGRNDSRWNISWKNNTTLYQNLYSFINFQSTSDAYFFRDIGNNQFGETRTSYLPRKFGLTWNSSFLKIDINVNRYQILNPFSFEEYRSMPSVTVQSFQSKGGLSISFFANRTKFELEEINPLRDSYKHIERTYFEPEISFRKHFGSSQILIATGTTYTNHNLNSKKTSQSFPWIEMKYNLFLDKYQGNSHTSLLPTFKYVYVKKEETKQNYLVDSRIISLDYSTLFQRNRFVGFDRVTKSNKVILGLERVSRSITNLSYSSLSIGQAFYINKETDYLNPLIYRNRSPLIAEFKIELGRNLRSKGLMEWDEKSKKINLASFGFVYKKNEQKRIEVKSIYRRKDPNSVYIPWIDRESPTNHSEVLVQWSLSKSVNLFGRWQKDQERNKSNDILFGFEYSNCCLKWGLMHRKWIDEDYFSWQSNYPSAFEALYQGLDPSRQRDNTYLFFELKNLGRLGKKISTALSSTKLE